MEYDVMGVPKLYDFEGLKFYGVNDYERYLSSLYGDYMKLPPLDKRVSHHKIIKLDLNSPYDEQEVL